MIKKGSEKMVKQILLLGDSALYEKSVAVQKEEDLTQLVQDWIIEKNIMRAEPLPLRKLA